MSSESRTGRWEGSGEGGELVRGHVPGVDACVLCVCVHRCQNEFLKQENCKITERFKVEGSIIKVVWML